MYNLSRIISRLSSVSLNPSTRASGFLTGNASASSKFLQSATNRAFSAKSGSDGVGGDDNGWDISTGGSFGGTGSDDLDWDNKSMWSTGLTKEHFDGVSVGRQKNAANPSSGNTASDSGDVNEYDDMLKEIEQDNRQGRAFVDGIKQRMMEISVLLKLGPKEVALVNEMNEYDDMLKEIEQDNRQGRAFVDGIKQRMMEISVLLKQVKEPGARGSYLKDSEKTEMYRLHKENPEVYTVERLAKDYRIMRQRVHAILFLKEDEEEEERKLGRPLDDSVERLLDEYPEFFISHDREFHVASLNYKPDFKVMPEGWDGTIKDMDEVHYDISKKEDDMLYEEFVRKFEFNKMKWRGEVKCHKYSRRRSSDGWKITVEKLGAKGKRGAGGGWKFMSLPDGSSRPLNDVEKIYVKRETPLRRRSMVSTEMMRYSPGNQKRRSKRKQKRKERRVECLKAGKQT